jgi:hypothetical protein
MIGGDRVHRSRGEPPRAAMQAPIVADALSVAAITILSALPYLRYLGFYSDDWGILAGFTADPQGWLAAGTSGVFRARPVQGLYLALLFKLFGLRPLGYHVINTAVLAMCATLLFALLLRLRFQRSQSFAAALLFIMLPQLSTVRVWYAAFQVPLSLALTLISMHCQLSFARSGDRAWFGAAILAALLSIGAYEIFAPLLVGFAITLAFLTWRSAHALPRNRTLIAAPVLVCTVLLAAVYKLTFSNRAGQIADPNRYLMGLRQLFRLDYDWREDSGLNIVATPQAHFWAPMRGWWTGAHALISGNAGAGITVIALLISALAWWRLHSAKVSGEEPTPKRLLFVGVAAFLLGNATFLIVPAVVFTSTGMDNRVHVAAAVGVAIIFSAGMAILAKSIPRRARDPVFNVAVVTVTASALVRLASVERYWAEAPAMQHQILSAARADLRDVPANSTVILDGVCPYHGPAVVFEENWDVSGAFTLALGRAITGDVVTSRMIPARKALLTSIYKQWSSYPYGNQLYIYNPSAHRLYHLADRQAAARYFAQHKLRPCPGYVARGVEV